MHACVDATGDGCKKFAGKCRAMNMLQAPFSQELVVSKIQKIGFLHFGPGAAFCQAQRRLPDCRCAGYRSLREARKSIVYKAESETGQGFESEAFAPLSSKALLALWALMPALSGKASCRLEVAALRSRGFGLKLQLSGQSFWPWNLSGSTRELSSHALTQSLPSRLFLISLSLHGFFLRAQS